MVSVKMDSSELDEMAGSIRYLAKYDAECNPQSLFQLALLLLDAHLIDRFHSKWWHSRYIKDESR